MGTQNVTLSVRSEQLRWFRDFCGKQEGHMSAYLDAWIGGLQKEIEAKGEDFIGNCSECGFLMSLAEFRRCMMVCPKCHKIIVDFKERKYMVD